MMSLMNVKKVMKRTKINYDSQVEISMMNHLSSNKSNE